MALTSRKEGRGAVLSEVPQVCVPHASDSAVRGDVRDLAAMRRGATVAERGRKTTANIPDIAAFGAQSNNYRPKPSLACDLSTGADRTDPLGVTLKRQDASLYRKVQRLAADGVVDGLARHPWQSCPQRYRTNGSSAPASQMLSAYIAACGESWRLRCAKCVADGVALCTVGEGGRHCEASLCDGPHACAWTGTSPAAVADATAVVGRTCAHGEVLVQPFRIEIRRSA